MRQRFEKEEDDKDRKDYLYQHAKKEHNKISTEKKNIVKKNSDFSIIWNQKKEKITLGGAMVLRMEAEYLQHRKKKPIKLFTERNNTVLFKRIYQSVFKSSIYKFKLSKKHPTGKIWPLNEHNICPHFSYFSFLRLKNIKKPKKLFVLQWSKNIKNKASRFLNKIKRPLVCLHIKQVPPFAQRDSNADLKEWFAFLKEYATSQNISFLILGDDKIKLPQYLKNKNIILAKHKIPLNIQLAMVSICDGFIGMASGIATAANFSKTPYVIFKHPNHHAKSMQRELKKRCSFDFALPNQFIWRKKASKSNLLKALDVVLTDSVKAR